tara:strand:- start:2032 stop:2343 length:312 start_codon:yes stop_codon:yes gene_type:complete
VIYWNDFKFDERLGPTLEVPESKVRKEKGRSVIKEDRQRGSKPNENGHSEIVQETRTDSRLARMAGKDGSLSFIPEDSFRDSSRKCKDASEEDFFHFREGESI